MTRTPETTYRVWIELPYVAGGGGCDDRTLDNLLAWLDTMTADYGPPTNVEDKTSILTGYQVARFTYSAGAINEQRVSIGNVSTKDLFA